MPEVPLLELGVVVGAHGLRGQLRIKLFSPSPESLAQLPRVFLRRGDGDAAEFPLRSVRQGGKGSWVVALQGCTRREEAEALVGATLLAARQDLPPLAEDEFYVADAVGCEAVLAEGARLGRVVAVEDNGAQCLLTVRGPALQVSVPATPPFVQQFDGKVLVLSLPEGYLDALAVPVESAT